ncbi:MAG TPA: PEP-CTERM sorting domain-containing protein [Armatimonadota bacterium]|nr:PEP-CTERM sorting domain-containing protein [Armatimonadota bacterium]
MNYGAHNYWVDLALAESAVPEPSAFPVLGSGFVGILIWLRRRKT